ncbi:60S ribosomal protein L23a-like [Sciurus carolinensis]|uniref:60S ribosomal protein L23a-like n=1 Tax=Sciurus carolinensis TaxID=30640 RepID=UPI001FB474AD|nr:60S ribosomal protein L23a-like [Sciurus carolinensis]
MTIKKTKKIRGPFHPSGAELKKETPATSVAKVFEGQEGSAKTNLPVIHPRPGGPRTCDCEGSPDTLQERSGRNKRDHYAVELPLTTECTIRKTESDNTLVLIVEVKANKHQVKQAVKKLHDIGVAKVTTTLIRVDGEKEEKFGF